LSAETIIAAAMALADAEGMDAVSMRSVARALGVEAMSLYHHVKTKERMVDGMVDAVYAQIHRPAKEGPWKEELRRRAISGREVLLRHRWALPLMDSRRGAGQATIRHLDAVLGCLMEAGFSLPLTGHAVALLDAQLFGHLNQELALPFGTPEELAEVGAEIAASIDFEKVPHFARFATEHAMQPGYDFSHEFGWGLDRVLEILELALEAEQSAPGRKVSPRKRPPSKPAPRRRTRA
jgi:AcrR family transcriptional regulator